MNLEKLVTSFDLSKRLKSAGVEQSANYWWSDEGNLMYEMAGRLPNINYKAYHYSAFLAEELLAMLPGEIKTSDGSNRTYILVIDRDGFDVMWQVQYIFDNCGTWEILRKEERDYYKNSEHLAEAAGELLLKIWEGGK